MNLNELLQMLLDIIQGIHQWMVTGEWAANALLDLFLHAMWSGVASLVGLWGAYYAARTVYLALGGKAAGPGISYTITKRVVSLCILAQFLVDVLGHAYAVFRQGYPVTLENLGRYAARDFHSGSWSVAVVLVVGFGLYLLARMPAAVAHPEDEGAVFHLNTVTMRFSYVVALFASLSAHMWWDRLLGPV